MLPRESSFGPGRDIGRSDTDAQAKWMTKWCNLFLQKRGPNFVITNLFRDFEDGMRLMALVEELSHEPLPGRYQRPPASNEKNPGAYKFMCVQNLNVALKYINTFVKNQKLGLQYGAEEIFEGESKMIMGMVWVLILRFTITDITEEDATAKEGLLLWCKKKTQGYRDVKIDNFGFSWQNGLAFAALIHKHHPDLIDFDSLRKENARENLELVFRVAQDKLGIPALLEPENLLVGRPDEKGVQAYLAFLWKRFASQSSAEVAGRRIARVVTRTARMEEMKDAYSQRAAEWAAWAREKQAGFERRDFEDLDRAARELAAFKKIEKPAKIQEKLELAQVFTSILAKSRGAWQPPEAISPQAIDGLYVGLSKAEHEYELALRAALSRRRRLDALLKLWRVKCKGMEQFVSEHAAMLAIEQVPRSSLYAVQTKIKMQDAFADELAANADRLAKVGELREQVVAAAPLASHHPEVNRRTDAVMEAWETLKIQSAKLKEALAKELAVQQRLEETRLAYASKAEAVHGALEDLIDTAQEPVDAYSSEEAQAMAAALEPLRSTLQAKAADVEALRTLGASLPDNPYSRRFPADKLQAELAEAQRLLDQRAKAVELEIVRQVENERLCRSFADDSARLLAACKEAPQDAVKIIAAGASPEESARHLEILKQKFEEAATREWVRLKELDENLQARGVTENPFTQASVQLLALEKDAAVRLLGDKVQEVEATMASVRSAGLSAEQQRAYAEVFSHFDKDMDGVLQRRELEACLQALDIESGAEQLEELFGAKANDGVTLSDLISVLERRMSDIEGPEQLREAFKALAKGKDHVTADDLAVLPAQAAEFLLARMPKNPSRPGCYDYAAYTKAMFS
eukprot:tig00021098_g18206.t1